MGCVTGCGTDTESGPAAAASADLTAAKGQTLTEKVKAAYEARSGFDAAWLPGEKSFDGSKLPGQAKIDFDADAEVCQGYGYGYPEARVATVDGQTVYAISGIVSDTGDILGFYDAAGNFLCEAYSGQGAQPNEHGVDWWR